MPNYLAISPKECQGLAWHPPRDLSFAASNPLVPIHAGEMAKAAASMPIAIIKQERELKLVAVAGLNPHHNLFIKDGEWVGHYQPQSLKTWPFNVVHIGEKGVITLDQDSGVVTQNSDEPGAEPFFDGQGRPAPALEAVVNELKSNHSRHRATQKALNELVSAKVIVPWPENLLSSVNMHIPGLHIVDEKALSQLSDEAFLKLRSAQALPIAYGINFSLAQAHLLTRLARLNPAQTAPPENLDDFFDGGDELNFDFDS